MIPHRANTSRAMSAPDLNQPGRGLRNNQPKQFRRVAGETGNMVTHPCQGHVAPTGHAPKLFKQTGGTMTRNLSRAEIRNMCPCPKCGADISKRCQHTGKGAKKANSRGQNHHDRMHAAQTESNHSHQIPEEVIE